MAENEAEKLQKQISFLTSLISAHRNIHGNQPARYAGPHRDHNPSTTSYSSRSHSIRPPGNKKWVRPGIQTGEQCRASTHHPSTLTQGSQESHHRQQGKGTGKTELGKHPSRQGASATTSGVAVSKTSKIKEREHCSSVTESSNIVNTKITNAVPATNRKLVKSKTLHDEKALGVKPSTATKPSDSGTKSKPATKLLDPSVKTGNDRKALSNNTVIKSTSGGNVLDPDIKLRKETKVKDSNDTLSKDTKMLVSDPGIKDKKDTRTSAPDTGQRSDTKASETSIKIIKDLKTLDCDIEQVQETKNVDPNIGQKKETSASDPGNKVLDPSILLRKGKKITTPGNKLKEIKPVSVSDNTSFKEHIPQENLKSTPQDPLTSKHSAGPAEEEHHTSSSGTSQTKSKTSKTLPQTSTPQCSVNPLQANSALTDLSQKGSIDISSQSIMGVEKMIPASVKVPGTSSKEKELVIIEQSGVSDPRETGDVLASTEEPNTSKEPNSSSIKKDSVQNSQTLFVSDKSTSGMRKVLAVQGRKPKVSEPQSGEIPSHNITPPENSQAKPSGTRTVLLPADLSSRTGTLSNRSNVLGSNPKTGSNQGKQNNARKVIAPASVFSKQTSCLSVDDDLVQKLPQGAGQSKPPQLGKSLDPKIDQPGPTTSKALQQRNSLDPAEVDVPSEEKLKSKDMGKCTVITTSKTKPSLTSNTRVLSTTDADTSGRKGTKDNTEDALTRTSVHAGNKSKTKGICDSKLSTKDIVQTKSDLSEKSVSEKPNLSPIRPPTRESKITPSIPEKALGKNDVKKVLVGDPGKIIQSTLTTVSPITQNTAGVTKSANRTVLAQSDPSGFQQNVHPMKKLVPSRYVWVAKKQSALDLPPRSALSKRNVKKLVIATQQDISVSSHPGPSPRSESSKGNPAKAVSVKLNVGQSSHCEPLVRSVSSKSNVKKVVSLRQHDIGESSQYVPPNRSQLSKRSPERPVSVSQDAGEFSHSGSLDDSFSEEKSLQSAARAFLEKVAFQMVQDDSPGRNMELVQREEEDVSHSDSQQHEEDMQRAAKAFLAGINDSYSSKSDGELQSAARVFLQKQLFKPEKIVKTKYSWKKITATTSQQHVPPASPGSSMNMQLKNPRTFSKSSQSRQVVTSRFKIRKVPSLVNNTPYNSMSLSRPPTSGQKMAKVIASKYKLRKVYTQTTGTTKSSTSSKYRYRRTAPKSPTIFKPTVHPLLSINAHKRNMVKHNLSQTVVRTKYKIVKNSSLVEGENPLYKASSRLPSRSKLKWVNKNSPQKVAQPAMSRRKVEPKSHTWNTRFSLKRPKGHRLSINQILGRSVKNLSQNKYKFIKAPASTLNRRSALLTSKFLQRKLTHHLPAKNKLKIDRRGKSAGESQASSGQSKRLVVIGGMLYRSSRRKLTKAPPTGFKKVKRNVIIRKLNGSNMKTISVRGVKFKMDQGGKTLRRVDSSATPAFSPSKPGAGVQQKRAVTRVDIGGVTYIQTKPGTLVKASTAKNRVLASRAVHRSIATATAARYKKNNLKKTKWKKYCMFFNRFGKCNRGEKCPYQHDPNRVAVCTRFLRGTCKVQDCPFSHKVAKEKMPVCLYFLRGVCSHDDCPYLHVNVNKDAKVCQDFIEGYCPLGDKCQRKHTLACPTFSRTGACPEGSRCKMYHPKKKGQKRSVKGRRRSKSQSQGKETDISAGEGTSNTNNKQGSSKDEEPPAEEDDSNIPFKKRRLPSFISIRSEESSETKEKSELAGAPPLKIHPNLD